MNCDNSGRTSSTCPKQVYVWFRLAINVYVYRIIRAPNIHFSQNISQVCGCENGLKIKNEFWRGYHLQSSTPDRARARRGPEEEYGCWATNGNRIHSGKTGNLNTFCPWNLSHLPTLFDPDVINVNLISAGSSAWPQGSKKINDGCNS